MRHILPVDPDIEDLRARVERLYREAEDAAKTRDRLRIETIAAKIRVFEATLAELTGHDETSGLHKRTHRATITNTMDVQKVQKPKRRPGVKLTSKGPIAIAARQSGKSMYEVADELGESYDTVKTWNRRASAPERIQARLSKPPYSVPLTAWK
jgi:hypothetical protein